MVEIWQVPKVAHMKEFAPLVLKVKIRAHFDQVTSLCWSPDSRYLLTASKDMTAKVLAMDGPEDYEPFTLAAHKDGLLGAFFAPDMRTVSVVSCCRCCGHVCFYRFCLDSDSVSRAVFRFIQ